MILSYQIQWTVGSVVELSITLDHRGPGSDGTEGVLCIPQSSSYCRLTLRYPGYSFGSGPTPQKRHSVYSKLNCSARIDSALNNPRRLISL